MHANGFTSNYLASSITSLNAVRIDKVHLPLYGEEIFFDIIRSKRNRVMRNAL